MSSSNNPRIISAEDKASDKVTILEMLDFSDGKEVEYYREAKFKNASYLEEAISANKGIFKGTFDDYLNEKKVETPAEEELPTPEEILEEAKKKADGIAEAARHEGYKQGMAEAQEEIEAALNNFARISEEIASCRPQLIDDLEKDLVNVVKLATSKVIGQELLINPDIISNIVNEALKQTQKDMFVHIYLNPDQVESIEPILSDLAANNPHLKGLEIIADNNITSGGCILRSEKEEVDASLETRMKNLNEAMDLVLKGITNGD